MEEREKNAQASETPQHNAETKRKREKGPPPGSDEWTRQKKAAFLAALKEKYSVTHAVRVAGIARSTAYKWRDEDEEFAQAWDDAKEDAIDALEESLYERAMKNDTVAAIFLLKGARPEKYKDRVANEVTGKGGGPVQTEVIVRFVGEEEAK